MKPVAYINVEERKLEWAEPITWHTPTIAQMEKIPLYTHPAKTLSKDELKIMWQAAMSKAYKEEDGEAYEFFANAILKKASE
jgi:hypothetical protein